MNSFCKAAVSLSMAWPIFAAAGVATEPFQIDGDYPGGNIVVKKIAGDTAYIEQDIRDTTQWWFYYNFRVRGAAGRTLTFRWTNRNPMAAQGPAVSSDGGRSWQWLGAKTVKDNSFQYDFTDDAEEVRFCLAMPYQLADVEQYIERHRGSAHFRAETHTTTPKDRPVHRLLVGKLDGPPKYRVLLTARHHACEMMASYVLEGILDAALADTDDGRWFRENVELLAVPIVDVDGVEDGDQGKHRRPHDHNRDYEGEPIYAAVAANKEFIPKWSAGKLHIALDLHCPGVRGGGTNRGSNEQIFFVFGPDAELWSNATKLASFLEAMQTGPLLYATKHNLRHRESWNVPEAPGERRAISRWVATVPGIEVPGCIEIPYAVAGGKPVTPASARALGDDVARAIRRYLQGLGE